ncbi:MAG TPA: amidohydrolase [Steroidobacteraceae bacterium]
MLLVSCLFGTANAADSESAIDAAVAAVDAKVIAWRRDFHQNPELSNREVRTSKVVAAHLKKLGLEVETGIATTGVVALLRTGRPGPTVALRADMDALPVTERTDVPFRSVARANYRGEEVGVMHACGHDAHTAVLMGVAEALVGSRAGLRGNVLFVFQPAEEGVLPGEVGGASEMVKAGIFEKYQPEVTIGSHAWASLNTGEIGYRVGPLMADSNVWRIVVKGQQSHGSRPWNGVDPILVASQIVTSLNTIVSRQVDITDNPAVLSVGIIKGGVRNNIIPESAELIGTLRTFTPGQKAKIVAGMKRMAENVATASGAKAEFELDRYSNPVVVNDAKLTEKLLPALERVAGKEHVNVVPLVTGSEDFAYFAQKVPSFFFFYGVTPRDQNAATAPSNHSPDFFLDEAAMAMAVRAMTAVAVEYLK